MDWMNLGLNPKQALYAARRAAGDTQAAAAREVGIAERTARRWEAQEEIQAAILEAGAELWQGLRDRVPQGLNRAWDTALGMLDNGATDGIRLKAAALLLDSGLKLRDRDIEARLAALEDELGLGKR